LFNKHKVKFCIVGAYAFAYHSTPRYTKDIDILVEPTTENGHKIIKALEAFGFASLKLSENDFNQEKQVIQLGYEPVRIDLLTSVEGCSFKEVWQNKKRGKYGKTSVYYIGLDELIKNKQKLMRSQDVADLEELNKLRRKTK
jgi:predicted nucleotidyltransferase